jgi:restriction system protein
MEIPKFDETFIPILEVLKTGKVFKTRELIEAVKTQFYTGLTDEQQKIETKSGDLLIDNRISWGKSYLKRSGYISFPERGHVQITEKGKAHSSSLSLKDLENEDTLLDFYRQEKQSIIEGNTLKSNISSPQDLIDEGFNRIESEIKNELLIKLKNIDPYFFKK